MKKSEFVHTKEHQRPAVWKPCLHITDCNCTPENSDLREVCQTCGEPAIYAMIFIWNINMTLYSCEKCK